MGKVVNFRYDFEIIINQFFSSRCDYHSEFNVRYWQLRTRAHTVTVGISNVTSC